MVCTNEKSIETVLSKHDVDVIDNLLQKGSFFPFTLESFVHLIVSFTESKNIASRMSKIAMDSAANVRKLRGL